MTQELINQLPTINNAQKSIIEMSTPNCFIEQRPGRGGMTFNYVEIGYVINRLNVAFGFDWDFDIIDDKQIGDQIIVKGKLTVRIKDRSISKTQYGSAEIKKQKNSNNPIDIADDYKGAASDSLKKCASMIGLASDVYYPKVFSKISEIKNMQKPPKTPPTTSTPHNLPSQPLKPQGEAPINAGKAFFRDIPPEITLSELISHSTDQRLHKDKPFVKACVHQINDMDLHNITVNCPACKGFAQLVHGYNPQQAPFVAIRCNSDKKHTYFSNSSKFVKSFLRQPNLLKAVNDYMQVATPSNVWKVADNNLVK